MPDPDNPEPPPRGGATFLWVSAILLCLASTAILLLSGDIRLLRLGLVAALWAALAAGFAVVKLRDRLDDEDERTEQMQRIYELELEREIAARREFELEVEQEARERAAEQSRAEIEALRGELRNLKESLEQVLGGDVLFERVALRAEPARMRALAEAAQQHPEANRVVHPQQWGRELPSTPQANGSTELINRLSGEQQRPQQQNTRPPQPPSRAPQYVRPAGHTPPKTVAQAPEQPAYERVHPPPAFAGPDQAARSNPAMPYPPAPGGQGPPEWQQRQAHAPVGSGPPARVRGAKSVDGEPSPPAAEESAPEPKPRRTASQAAAGAHTEGTSVRELLAAYNKDADGPRSSRRRRE